MTEKVDVYVDGACIGNGLPFPDSGAGIGVWFGDNHPLNYNWILCGDGTDNDNQTNQRAEIQAARFAISIAADEENIFALRINTDSKYVLDRIAENSIEKWKANGWKNSRGRPVANKGDWMNLANEIAKYETDGRKLEWRHVKAHSGNYGNEQADQLAKKAAQAKYDYNQCLAASNCSEEEQRMAKRNLYKSIWESRQRFLPK